MKNKVEKILNISLITFVSLFLVFMGIYCVKVALIPVPNADYAKFMIELNNTFVKDMYNFVKAQENFDSLSENEKKLQRTYMSSLVLNQHNEVNKLTENPPNDKNKDFLYTAEQLRQSYLFHLEGEIGILEQLYELPENRNQTKLSSGYALQNTMGEVILQFPKLINNIRNTQYAPNYTYVPDENSMLIDGILTDQEYEDKLEKEDNLELDIPNKG